MESVFKYFCVSVCVHVLYGIYKCLLRMRAPLYTDDHVNARAACPLRKRAFAHNKHYFQGFTGRARVLDALHTELRSLTPLAY